MFTNFTNGTWYPSRESNSDAFAAGSKPAVSASSTKGAFYGFTRQLFSSELAYLNSTEHVASAKAFHLGSYSAPLTRLTFLPIASAVISNRQCDRRS